MMSMHFLLTNMEAPSSLFFSFKRENQISWFKRRRRISTSEDDDSSRPPLPTTPGFQSPPLHKIYNSSRKDKPDELFRKDLISAMKLPDSEQLDESEFWDMVIRGAGMGERCSSSCQFQECTSSSCQVLDLNYLKNLCGQQKTVFFSNEHHVLTDTAAKAESVCKYDMDNLDFQWLNNYNEMRVEMGLSTLDEVTLERVEEDFELQCSNRFQDALKTEKGPWHRI
ncbi:PHD finger protein rhinoceros [Caerostris extrusa]|uniref:PHD finger protein rhinoceros n=1 Tax=Caerostris extrusa TaxID=172846 RepID=A0AAV4T6I1_CAEEX|nr:PHD finger protein rhinoceros [Caerostris extrusa]